MKQLQQLVDSGLMEEHDGGWRPVYVGGICREPKTLTEEQREARRKAGSKGGRRKAANQKAKQTSGDLPENSQANGEQNSSCLLYTSMPEPPTRQGKDVKTGRTGHLLSSPPARPSPGPAIGGLSLIHI